MKIFKICFIIIGVFMLLLTGCNNKPIDEDPMDPIITLIGTNIEITSGENYQLHPEILEGDVTLKFLFSSNNVNVATVDENGLVTAHIPGNAVITVYLENYRDLDIEVNIKVVYSDQQIAQIVLDWAKELVDRELSNDISLPSTHPDYDAQITWESSDEDSLTSDGEINQKEYDINVNLTISVVYKSINVDDTIDITVTGYALEIVANSFLNQFSKLITRDYNNIKLTHTSYQNATITWQSSNPEVFTNDGIYIKPIENTKIIIYCTVSFEDLGISRTFSKEVTVQGISIIEKVSEIEKAVLVDLNINRIIYDSLELPIYFAEYNATLTWTSNFPDIISTTGQVVRPALNRIVSLRCEVTSNNETAPFRIEIEVAGVHYDEKWNAVEELLNFIFIDQIKTQRYTMFGVTFDYESYNYGYIPFYINSPSVILDGMMNRDRSIRTETRWIVIHDTANTNETANAEMHYRYLQTNPGTSWHYTVDDNDIYQHLPNNRTAAHAGASEGNNYGIGIETCINYGVDYNQVMRKTAKLTSELMKEYDLTLYSIRQHFFFSGKDCPHVMRAANRWNEFLDLVAMEYLAITQLEGVEFVWESLSPTILDNNGRISPLFNHPGGEIDVSFKVAVTYNGVTKEYTHTAKLLPPSWL